MTLVITGLFAAAILGVIIIGAPRLERALLYHPSGGRVAPEEIGLEGVLEVMMDAPDGAQIIAWYSPATPGNFTVLYFHGNGASLAARADRVRLFQDRGFGIFMMSYRGYSGSTGIPSERDNVSDAKRAYDELIAAGVAASQIVLYGESLGTGVAVQVAGEKPVAGVILDAPYTSIVDVAEACYPALPSRLVMRDRYETMEHLKRVNVPVLVIHGEADRVIPVAMGRAVAGAAPGPAKIVTFPGAGHTDHHEFGSVDAVAQWLSRLGS